RRYRFHEIAGLRRVCPGPSVAGTEPDHCKSRSRSYGLRRSTRLLGERLAELSGDDARIFDQIRPRNSTRLAQKSPVGAGPSVEPKTRHQIWTVAWRMARHNRSGQAAACEIGKVSVSGLTVDLLV